MDLPKYRPKDDFINDQWLTEKFKLIPFHEREYVSSEYCRIYLEAGTREPNINAKTCTATRVANTYLRERIENGPIKAPKLSV